MNQTKALLYFFVTDSIRPLKIFWSIYFATLIVLIGLAAFTDNMFFSYSAPPYVFTAVFGFITVKESLPFSIQMGSTRKNYYLTAGIFGTAVSAVISLILVLLQLLTYVMLPIFNLNNFRYLRLYSADNEIGTILTNSAFDFSIMLIGYTILFFTGLLYYRCGILGAGLFGGIILILITIALTNLNRLEPIFEWVTALSVIEAALVLITASLCFYLLSWALVRNSSSTPYRYS